jgi:membrane associated rhomboid family serine protease
LFSYLDDISFSIFYIVSGVLASLGGFAIDTVTAKRPMLPAIRLRPGVGASGAVFSVFALSCFSFPETNYMIIFFPFFTIPAFYAMGGSVSAFAITIPYSI